MVDIEVLEDPQCKYLFGKIDVIISQLSLPSLAFASMHLIQIPFHININGSLWHRYLYSYIYGWMRASDSRKVSMLTHERGENLTLFSRAHTRIYINPLATRSHCGAKMILFMRATDSDLGLIRWYHSRDILRKSISAGKPETSFAVETEHRGPKCIFRRKEGWMMKREGQNGWN